MAQLLVVADHPGCRVRRRRYSEDTAREIDCAVRELIHAACEHAPAILTRHRDVLEESAQRLLEKETLTTDELPRLESPEAGERNFDTPGKP